MSGKSTAVATASASHPLAPPRPRIADGTGDQKTTVELQLGGTAHLGGSTEDEFNALVLCETLACAQASFGQDQAARLAAVSAALAAFKPKDEIEGMIAAQAVALHMSAMECLRRAMLPNQNPDSASKLRRDSANLARAMTDMVEALDRKRGKGPQVVRVERVVVHEGGQAIVGNVAPGVAGGRAGLEDHDPMPGQY